MPTGCGEKRTAFFPQLPPLLGLWKAGGKKVYISCHRTTAPGKAAHSSYRRSLLCQSLLCSAAHHHPLPCSFPGMCSSSAHAASCDLPLHLLSFCYSSISSSTTQFVDNNSQPFSYLWCIYVLGMWQ